MFGYRRGSTPLKTLLLLGAMSFLLYVDRVNLSTAAGPIMQELGLSNTELGLVSRLSRIPTRCSRSSEDGSATASGRG